MTSFYRSSLSACRRLSMQSPTFYSRTSTARSQSEVFVPQSPEREQEHYWGPGQVIPHMPLAQSSPLETSPLGSSPHELSPPPQHNDELKSLMQGLQSSVETNFQAIKKQLCDLEGRVAKVEGKQVELQNSPSSSGSSSSSNDHCDSRKRRSPPDLQVRLCVTPV